MMNKRALNELQQVQKTKTRHTEKYKASKVLLKQKKFVK